MEGIQSDDASSHSKDGTNFATQSYRLGTYTGRNPMDTFFGADYWLTRFCLQRALGFVYLIAFLIAVVQFRPLLGERGLLPVPLFLRRVRFWDAPSLFHWHYSDHAFSLVAWSGLTLSLLAVLGLSDAFGTPVSVLVWGLLWLLYLSIVNVGQKFYGFGWESTLLETGFLAIFLGASNTTAPDVMIWLLRWVLFRVMFGAGLIKLRGDPCWRNLTCLAYHYETQPLPNPLSWYLHWQPLWMHKAGVLFTHFVELVVPWGYFMPPPVCYIAGLLTIVFQGTLILSGNLSWLNYITIVLALSCFDDQALSWIIPLNVPEVEPRALIHNLLLGAITLLVVALSIRPIKNMWSHEQRMNASFDPLHLVNTYGAFGSVSRERMEIIVEGTLDPEISSRTEWREYEFKGKPGDVMRRPCIVSPYHWKLDWQMWFAAMSPYYRHPWLLHLIAKLLQGDRAILSLLSQRRKPFPDRPPTHIRAQLYQYHFAEWQDGRKSGAWWVRTRVGQYLPPLSLEDPEFRDLLRRQGWLEIEEQPTKREFQEASRHTFGRR
jgi:hypothetical protein